MAQRCEGIKADGEQCGAWAALGGTLCAGHAGLGIAADPAGYAKAANAKSVEVRQARAEERKMSLLERLARLLEADAEQIASEYRAAGKGGDWRATEALITRVHGKPVERVQVEAPADPLGVAQMTPQERAELLAQVLEQHPHLAPLAGADMVQH
jgi:hypothetical protein